MLADQLDRLVAVRRALGQGLQLQLEALADVARADARRLHVLHVAQRYLQLYNTSVSGLNAWTKGNEMSPSPVVRSAAGPTP